MRRITWQEFVQNHTPSGNPISKACKLIRDMPRWQNGPNAIRNYQGSHGRCRQLSDAQDALLTIVEREWRDSTDRPVARPVAREGWALFGSGGALHVPIRAMAHDDMRMDAQDEDSTTDIYPDAVVEYAEAGAL